MGAELAGYMQGEAFPARPDRSVGSVRWIDAVPDTGTPCAASIVPPSPRPGPLAASAQGLPSFCVHFLQHPDLEHLVGHDLLELPIFPLQLPVAPGVLQFHPAVLLLPPNASPSSRAYPLRDLADWIGGLCFFRMI
jgi:hypothetical protein